MKIGLYLLICFSLVSSSNLKAETAEGIVFEDINGNGVQDEGESGIAGVRVSNGDDVVQTQANGFYELKIDEEAIIFISKPRGYVTPLNKHKLPQFYYIHQPAGSPEGLRFPGIEPTGALPETINFGLQKRDEPRKFEAILLADTQPETDAELSYIRDDVV